MARLDEGGPFLRDWSCLEVESLAKNFNVFITKNWCKGCSLCVEICPKKVLALDDRQKSEPFKMDQCIGCRQCENICPDLAISVKEKEAKADE